MTEDFQTFRGTVERQFESIQRKLDRLDEAIRGTAANGSKPGILVRLDRLEQDAKRQSKLIWLIVGSLITALGSALVAWLLAGGITP
ncbi:MAG: hypothetical protein JJU36_11920 [Phycisphaeraceae bacterium]|nr:hypothetical protein [Phycisphaeraceae bacterium]